LGLASSEVFLFSWRLEKQQRGGEDKEKVSGGKYKKACHLNTAALSHPNARPTGIVEIAPDGDGALCRTSPELHTATIMAAVPT
jgi:hypothetical protein